MHHNPAQVKENRRAEPPAGVQNEHGSDPGAP
jgi:hypothetical protein